MVFNGGKGGQSSSGPSACGSRLCRCFGFVLLVVIGVLLYTCMTLVSRNDVLNDRVLMYARELTRTRTKDLGLEKRTAEMRQQHQVSMVLENHVAKDQNFHCHNQLSERSREYATLKLDTDSFKKQAEEFHQKLETMATELKTKEDACVQLDSSCKKQISEREDELKRAKELQESANVECEKQINVELARVIRVLRAKYGAEPVTELAKGGVDVARILQFMGGSQLPDSNQFQRSGQEQLRPNSGHEQPKPGQELPKPGQEQPRSGQEQSKSDQEQPQSSQEQPKSDQEQQPKSDQEQPKSGQGQGQLQFKRPEDIKRDEDQKQESEREKPNEEGKEKQKSIQEQPKTDQTEEEKKKKKKKSEREAADASVGRGSDHSNRDEWQTSTASPEKSREDEEEERPKQDDAKENARDDKDRPPADQERLLKENRAKEDEEKGTSETKDPRPRQEDAKSRQNSDRQEADEE